MSTRINNNNIFITKGDTLNIDFNITNQVDLSSCTVVFVVKEFPDDLDAQSLIYLEPKIDLENRVFNVFIPCNKTLKVGNFYWGFKIFETDGSDENIIFASTPCIGRFVVQKGIIDKGIGPGIIDLDSLNKINNIIYKLSFLIWEDCEYNYNCRNYNDILDVLVNIYLDLSHLYVKQIKIIDSISEMPPRLPDLSRMKTINAINSVFFNLKELLSDECSFVTVSDYKTLLVCFTILLSEITNKNNKLFDILDS